MQELKKQLEIHDTEEIHFSEIVNILKQYDEEKFYSRSHRSCVGVYMEIRCFI